jgi:chromosome segregation ATPase
MQTDMLSTRVNILERQMEGFDELPGRMTSLEGRMGSLEGRMGSLEERMGSLEERMGLLEERVASLEEQVSQLRSEMRTEFSNVRGEMREMRAELIARMDAGDQETRTLMRVLHEDVIDRIARLGEQLNGRARGARSIAGTASSGRLSRLRAKKSGAKKR